MDINQVLKQVDEHLSFSNYYDETYDSCRKMASVYEKEKNKSKTIKDFFKETEKTDLAILPKVIFIHNHPMDQYYLFEYEGHFNLSEFGFTQRGKNIFKIEMVIIDKNDLNYEDKKCLLMPDINKISKFVHIKMNGDYFYYK